MPEHHEERALSTNTVELIRKFSDATADGVAESALKEFVPHTISQAIARLLAIAALEAVLGVVFGCLAEAICGVVRDTEGRARLLETRVTQLERRLDELHLVFFRNAVAIGDAAFAEPPIFRQQRLHGALTELDRALLAAPPTERTAELEFCVRFLQGTYARALNDGEAYARERFATCVQILDDRIARADGAHSRCEAEIRLLRSITPEDDSETVNEMLGPLGLSATLHHKSPFADIRRREQLVRSVRAQRPARIAALRVEAAEALHTAETLKQQRAALLPLTAANSPSS